jgi:hypothetical protein
MDEESRRSLHRLIVRAVNKDALATVAIEEMIMGLDRAGSADDVAQSLQMILTIGGDEFHKSIITRLQENDQHGRQWPMIAQP